MFLFNVYAAVTDITNSSSLPIYNIGIIFPKTTDVIIDDPSLANMIVTNELAIQLAAEDIRNSNILPGNTSNECLYKMLSYVI